jgi:hypothetical protein
MGRAGICQKHLVPTSRLPATSHSGSSAEQARIEGDAGLQKLGNRQPALALAASVSSVALSAPGTWLSMPGRRKKPDRES